MRTLPKYLENSELTQHVHIQQMAEAAMGMLTDSIEAFVKKDSAAGQKGDESRMMRWMICSIRLRSEADSRQLPQSPDQGELCVDMVMVAKYFERIADHVVNIAEWVEYSVDRRT